MAIATSWSRTQVALHWLTVLLVLVQLFMHDWMEEAWDARMDGEPAASNDLAGAWFHAGVGASILVIMIARLVLRSRHGHPPSPQGQPGWASQLAAVTHYALYALLFAMPLSGAAAWFLGVEGAANLHAGPIRLALIALVLLHVAGALFEHFVLRTEALRRMLRLER